MTYRIVSNRVGVPGDLYVPAIGVNVAALLHGGFIVEVGTVSTEPPKKRRKVITDPEE